MQFDLTENMANFKQKPPPPALNGIKPWRRSVAWAALLAMGGILWSPAQQPAPLEYQVKAAFLVKFGSFIEWPATAPGTTNASFTIGLLGTDPFGRNFDEAVRSEHITRRRVTIRRAHDLAELNDCQIIFISTSEFSRWEELFRALDGKPVLVVGDAPDFAKRGGMIGFIKENDKVRFEINVAVAERAGLKLSAKLLQVGRIVVPGKLRTGGMK